MITQLFPTGSTGQRFVRARLGAAALAGLFGCVLAGDVAFARGSKDQIRSSNREEYVQSRPAGKAVMAIVSLRRQRVTLYDGDGWIMRAPVSSGRTGYETPAGIYSVLQRKVEHYSNLYDDAAMPFMQRLTWSGIALHAGPLPGYPASHGCVRMPSDFAERMYDASMMGMRVIVMRDDIAPVPFSHPRLFRPWSDEPTGRTATAPRVVAIDAAPQGIAPFRDLRRVAAVKSAEAEAAAKKLEKARRAMAAKRREAALANRKLRVAQSTKFRAERYQKQVESQLETASDPARADEIRAKAAETLAQAEANLQSVLAETQPMLGEVEALRAAAIEAQKAKVAADEEAREARRKVAPIAVFVSRATKRLYVRQALHPLFETEVAIADDDKPVGTHVFTALAYENGEQDLRWNAVSLSGGVPQKQTRSGGKAKGRASSASEPLQTDVAAAGSALERISIPDEALERITAVISPGSSLIVSDEPPSRETGSATEFIVVMSGEPQGGIKIRRPQSERRQRYDQLRIRRAPYGGGGGGWSFF